MGFDKSSSLTQTHNYFINWRNANLLLCPSRENNADAGSMLGSSQLAETTQSFYQRLCSQKNTRQQRRCRAKAVSVESPFKLTQTAQTGASASNQTRKIRPCLCVGPWLCCSGEAATFVLSLLCDAWYRRSEQRNAGGICESHVRACVCLRVRVHACVLCVLPLCGHSLRLMVLSVFCSCPCAPKPLFPSSSGPQSVSITSVITFYFSTSTTKLLCFHPGFLSSSAHDLTYFICLCFLICYFMIVILFFRNQTV